MFKRLLCIAAVFVLICANGGVKAEQFEPQDGKYMGVMTLHGNTPNECSPNPYASGYYITKIGDGVWDFAGFFLWEGYEIPLGSFTGYQNGQSNTLDIFDNSNGETQVIDLHPYDTDAIMYFTAGHGNGHFSGPSSFIERLSNQKMSCVGADCPYVALVYFGPGFFFPCHTLAHTWVMEKVD